MNHMYPDTKTWNVFVGCQHNCLYCKPSFQRQTKRWGKRHCKLCYDYVPHSHLERLGRIPSASLIFVAGNGDISFALPEVVETIIQKVWDTPHKTFLFQTKYAAFFHGFRFPTNVILGTTIETNRDDLCLKVSKAVPPSIRKQDMLWLAHPRKAVTVEPIMDFDLEILSSWIKEIKPEIVWVGYDNHKCHLTEPPLAKTMQLIEQLEKAGITVYRKTLR